MTPIQKVAGIGQVLAALLAAKGISTAEQLANTSPETLRTVPRLGALRASRLLAAARKIVPGAETEAAVAAPAAPVASMAAASADPAVRDEASAPKVKAGKKAAFAKPAKTSDTLDKAADKKAKKAKTVDAAKASKKDAAKTTKAASDSKAKAKKAPKKDTIKAAKSKAGKQSKAKADKTAKAKKKSQSKKK